MVFSATYCPYCAKVKTFLKELEVEHTVWELDEMLGGDEVKSWLAETTGQRTIPNVFIKGNHIGGSSGMLLYCLLSSLVVLFLFSYYYVATMSMIV